MNSLIRSFFVCVLCAFATTCFAQSTFRTVANFAPYPNGINFSGNLIVGPDQNYYGLTADGGVYNGGTFFRLTREGSLTTLVSFNPATTGSVPQQLIAGTDGNLYGIFSTVGPSGDHFFKLTFDGKLTSFFTSTSSAFGFIQGNDGYLYANAYINGSNWQLIKISTTTGIGTVLISYTGEPFTPQFQAQDGAIFGVKLGEQANVGGSFVVRADLTTDTFPSVAFLSSNQSIPQLIPGPNGSIYATISNSSNGTPEKGSIVQITPSGSIIPLVNFPGEIVPVQFLVGSNGNFYGTANEYQPIRQAITYEAVSGHSGGAVTILASANSSTSPDFIGIVQADNGDLAWEKADTGSIEQLSDGALTTLFDLNPMEVTRPTGPLLQGKDGNFYGTGVLGGTANFGGVYKSTSAGRITTLGSFPLAVTPMGLIQATDGNFYGVAGSAGSQTAIPGIFFTVSSTGVMTTFHSLFPGVPGSPIVEGSDGNFYGLTNTGGTYNSGTFYRITPAGQVAVIFSLDSTMSIPGPYAQPFQQIVVGPHHNFYAATPVALLGFPAPPSPPPVITPPAAKPIVLQSFSQTAGFAPTSLVIGTYGDLYGTSLFGGAFNQGTVFKLTLPTGVFSILHSLGPVEPVPVTGPGAIPSNGATGGPTSLTFGNDGNMFVTANGGFGTDTNHTYVGVVLQMGAGIKSLAFASTPGDAPNSIIQGVDGTLYGTTTQGGTAYSYTQEGFSGTLFNINPGLLTGTVIGTPGTFDTKFGNNTIAKVFDDNLSTFFDAPCPGTGDWVGLDLGSAKSITSLAYVPRTYFESRMVGGVFQGSNTADFSSGVVDLAPPIATQPGDHFTTVTVKATGTFRYVRYLSPTHGYGNISELEFYSEPATATP